MKPETWIEKNCKHLASAQNGLAGQPVKLLDFHKEILRELFDDQGNIIKRHFFIQSKRKISKTNLIAWILAYQFLYKGQTESGMTLPIISGRYKQTKECYDLISETIYKACKSKKRFIFLKEKILDKENRNKVILTTSNAKALYGLNPGPIAVFEEIQTWNPQDGDDLVGAITNAMGTRKNPLQIFACNPGKDFSNEFYKERLKHFREHKEHPDYLVKIYEAKNPKCDIFNRDEWLNADPSFDKKTKLSPINNFKNIEDMSRIASLSIEKEDDFRREQLGIVLMRNHMAFVDVRKFKILKVEDQLPVSIGADLSVNFDRTSICFTRKLPNDRGFLFSWRNYLPEGALGKFSKKKAKKNLEYADKGFLTLQKGDVINQDEIFEDIKTEIKKSTGCEGFFYDYNAGAGVLAERINGLTETKIMFSTGRHQTPLIQNLQRIAEGNMFHMAKDDQLVKDDFNNTLLKYGRQSKNFKLLDRVNTKDSIDSSFSCLYSLNPYEVNQSINWSLYT